MVLGRSTVWMVMVMVMVMIYDGIFRCDKWIHSVWKVWKNIFGEAFRAQKRQDRHVKHFHVNPFVPYICTIQRRNVTDRI
jgi:hypothetical protein